MYAFLFEDLTFVGDGVLTIKRFLIGTKQVVNKFWGKVSKQNSPSPQQTFKKEAISIHVPYYALLFESLRRCAYRRKRRLKKNKRKCIPVFIACKLRTVLSHMEFCVILYAAQDETATFRELCFYLYLSLKWNSVRGVYMMR